MLKTFETLYVLHSFRLYVEENERLIRQAAEEEERLHGPGWHPQTEEEYAEFHMERRNARHLHEKIMAPVFRYSCVVMLYTIVERELRRLGSNLEKEKGKAKLDYKDLKGGMLDQLSKWLHFSFGLRLSSFSGFSRIRDLQKIRDCIVHCNGEVEDSREKTVLLGFNGKYPGYSALKGIELEIEPELTSDMLSHVWSFFLTVFSELGWQIDSIWQREELAKSTPLQKPG